MVKMTDSGLLILLDIERFQERETSSNYKNSKETSNNH
jgi:hypothetical protein